MRIRTTLREASIGPWCKIRYSRGRHSTVAMSDACTSRAQTNLQVGRDAEVEALLSARQKIVHGTNINETRLAAAAPERGTYLRR